MRIQHNIAALNSYRQLSGNNNALSKNLEKLSSGYKINRAGDDAAGLAISEKMRAQIKGLEAAQKNANDGISLVQTAEGALTEVHDMLNRMVYLATQSANGTYDNDVDRANLQKEVSSLLDEIDRISESTNFNGLNLLDGTLGLNTSAFTDIKIGEATAETTAAGGVTVDEASVVASQATGKTAQKASFSVSLKNLSVDADGAGDVNIKVGDLTTKVTLADGDDVVDKYLTALGGANTDVTIDNVVYTVTKGTGDTAGMINFEQKTLPTKTDTAVINPDFEVSITGTNGNGAAAATAAKYEFDLTGATSTASAGTDTFTITIGGTTITSAADTTQTATTADKIAALFDGIADVTIDGVDYTVTAENSKVVLTAKTGSEGPLANGDSLDVANNTFALTATGATLGANPTATNAAFTDGQAANAGTTSGVNGEYIGHVVNTKSSVIPSDSKLAEVTFTLDFDKIKDGTQITVGTDTYTFAIGKDSDQDTTDAKVINLTDIEEADVATNQAKITTALVGALKGGNSVWEFSNADADAGKITLLEQKDNQTATDGMDLSTKDKVKDSIKMQTTVAAKAAESQVTVDGSKMVAGDKIEIDGKVYEFVADAADVSNEENTAVVVKGLSNKVGTAVDDAAQKLYEALGGDSNAKVTLDGKTIKVEAENTTAAAVDICSAGVKLQVGDTADEYNKVNVQVGRMDAKSLGIKDIDISTQEGAAAAITKIKTAINTVSSTRGDLGAIQNRLEHTINNLGVTTENITSAESRIRDTDMAEEMMAYTKNNILVQAAQAMLAQANQVPQGVLQLLQ